MTKLDITTAPIRILAHFDLENGYIETINGQIFVINEIQ